MKKFFLITLILFLAASGRYGLDGSLAFPAQIFIQPDLSAALIQSVEELRLFTDDQRRIALPVLVGELLNRAFKKEEQPSGE